MSRECRGNVAGEPEGSLRPLGLCRRQLPRESLQRVPDRQFAALEVNVLPRQREQLALPQSCADRRDVQRLARIPGDATEEAPSLVLGESRRPIGIEDKALIALTDELLIGELTGRRLLCSFDCGREAVTVAYPRLPTCLEHGPRSTPAATADRVSRQ